MRALALIVVAVSLAGCQNGVAVGAACLRNSDCTAPLVCGHGRCRPACRVDRDCGPGLSCLLEQDGTGTCSLDVETGCATSPADHPCACDLTCHEDQCVAACTLATDCASDGVCRQDVTHAGTFCFAVPAPDAGASGDGPAACTGGGVCVDAPPMGWLGPVQVFQGASVPSCPALTSMVLDGTSGLVAPETTCSTCTCGPVTGGMCGLPTATLFNDPMCGGTPCVTARPIGATCGMLKSMSECTSMALVYMNFESTQSGASCAPSPQTGVPPTATWTTQVRACAPTGIPSACGSSGVCAQPSPTASVCIYQAGDVACPGGAYTTRTLMATGFDEMRGCTPCACDTSSVTCTGGTVIVSQFAICTGGSPSAVPSACAVDPFASSSAFMAQSTVAATPSGSCTVVQSTATGAAVLTGQTTICCQ